MDIRGGFDDLDHGGILVGVLHGVDIFQFRNGLHGAGGQCDCG